MMEASYGLITGILSITMACMAGAIVKPLGICTMDGVLFELKCLNTVVMLEYFSGIEGRILAIDGR
jgi:hypothetical protein